MKTRLIVAALVAAVLSPQQVLAEEKKDEKKKEFGRKHLVITTVPATRALVAEVSSNVDKKMMKHQPLLKLVNNRRALRDLCYGAGPAYPDIAVTTREMNAEEYKRCENNSLSEIIRVKMGYEAIVLASAKDSKLDLALGQRDVFLAMAKDVPEPGYDGVLMSNPNKKWKEVNENLPDAAIRFYGPEARTRADRAVGQLAMEAGCRTWDWVPNLKDVQKTARMYVALCNEQRKDLYTKANKENPDPVASMLKDKGSVAVVGFNDYLAAKDKLKAYTIDEIPATQKTIDGGLYPASRPVYAYIKVSSLENVQAASHFMNELVSKKALGNDGYLAKMGLVALPEKALEKEITGALEFEVMERVEE